MIEATINIEAEFADVLATYGLNPPEIIADGVLHRFDSNEDKRGKKSAWYILHGDEIPAGAFGDWKTGLSEKWCSKTDHALTPVERAEYRSRIDQAKRHADAAQMQAATEAVEACNAIMATAQDATDDNPYCIRKGIKPYGLKEFKDKRTLIVPIRDGTGALTSLQFIGADGKKRFKSHGRFKGCYYAFGGRPVTTLLICEGFATGASLHAVTGHPIAVAFNGGNMEAVARVLRAKFPTIQIVICADNDRFNDGGNGGIDNAKAAAHAVGGMLAIPQFASDDGKPTDFNDLHQIEGIEAVRACINAAHSQDTPDDWPKPEPLFSSYDPLPYPLDALPVTIREAIEEVIGFVKAPIALAASSALSAVSVALQGLYDVERAPGLKSPCSLYMLSIAESGERKTSCDGFFKQALEAWQREQAEAMKPALADYEADKAAWDAKKSGVVDAIKKAAKEAKPTDRLEHELRQLERDKPAAVRVPRLIRGDDTPENLGWSLMREWPSAGVLSSEAGVVFGSHGMSGDSVSRNLALLNVLWDGGSNHIGRRTSDSYTVERVRLSMGLQVQESTLRSFFDKSKGLARGTGFLARFLMAWPSSTMGTRLYSEAPDWAKLHTFNVRIRQLLQSPLSIDDDGRLTTVTLSLSPQAHAAWIIFQNEIESQLSPEGELQDVKDVASKVADNAARLAALFHVFEHGAGAISVDAMVRGAQLAAWHLTEARRFLGQFAMPIEWMNAERLERWAIQHCERHNMTTISTKTALQYGPLRDKAALLAAQGHLEDYGRMRVVIDGRKKLIAINPALLMVTA